MAIQVRPVSYVDGDVELEGLFAFDEEVSGPRPLVIVVHAYGGRDLPWTSTAGTCLRRTPTKAKR